MNIANGRHEIARRSLVAASRARPLASETPRRIAPAGTGRPASADSARAVVDQYCVTCHNQRTRTAGLMLDKADLADVPANAEIWEKVIRKVRAGMMPPPGRAASGPGRA